MEEEESGREGVLGIIGKSQGKVRKHGRPGLVLGTRAEISTVKQIPLLIAG